MSGVIERITGPVVGAKNMAGVRMYDIVRVGDAGLMGEVIKLEDDYATIQVYEETAGLRVGEPVDPTNAPLTVELGPGLLTSVFDGIQRPLQALVEYSGAFIARGARVRSLDNKKKWPFTPCVAVGDVVRAGMSIGVVPEGRLDHHILVPPSVASSTDETDISLGSNAREVKITSLVEMGAYTLDETIAVLDDGTELTLSHKWPVRLQRPVEGKLDPSVPFISGMRILDTLFPIALGGNTIVPGGFGTGKTVTQQSLAKWADVDIIVYIGCGERGNEMTEVLTEFPQLEDPRHGVPLMERTVLIANTSNMPVAAREASIYTGITIAEYYRDMGYNVAMMADSTSRWGEALREVSGRLEEMPGEEGYPAYLATRLAAFYERSGRVIPLSHTKGDGCEGSVTMVGAVSPAGGDMSEPMTQNSLRVTGAFWALDTGLAHQRHFPAISWTKSYTLFLGQVRGWYEQNVATDWSVVRERLLLILQQEIELQEIVQLVGPDALPETEKGALEVARSVREDFLQQFAFDPVDAFCPIEKQMDIARVILAYEDELSDALERGIFLSQVTSLDIRRRIAALKTTEHEKAGRDAVTLLKDIPTSIRQLEVV